MQPVYWQVAISAICEYALQGRDAALIDLLLYELGFIAAPDIHLPLQASAKRLHMSVRTFSRQFREHTGMSVLGQAPRDFLQGDSVAPR